jgi:transcription elongation factor Elf1
VTHLTCPRCNQPLTADALLGASLGYSPVTDSGGSTCAACGEGLEFRVRAGVVELGFSYWAGSMHFEAVSTHRVKGLRLVSSGDRIEATLGERSYVLNPPRAEP